MYTECILRDFRFPESSFLRAYTLSAGKIALQDWDTFLASKNLVPCYDVHSVTIWMSLISINLCTCSTRTQIVYNVLFLCILTHNYALVLCEFILHIIQAKFSDSFRAIFSKFSNRTTKINIKFSDKKCNWAGFDKAASKKTQLRAKQEAEIHVPGAENIKTSVHTDRKSFEYKQPKL